MKDKLQLDKFEWDLLADALRRMMHREQSIIVNALKNGHDTKARRHQIKVREITEVLIKIGEREKRK